MPLCPSLPACPGPVDCSKISVVGKARRGHSTQHSSDFVEVCCSNLSGPFLPVSLFAQDYKGLLEQPAEPKFKARRAQSVRGPACLDLRQLAGSSGSNLRPLAALRRRADKKLSCSEIVTYTRLATVTHSMAVPRIRQEQQWLSPQCLEHPRSLVASFDLNSTCCQHQSDVSCHMKPTYHSSVLQATAMTPFPSPMA